MSDNLTKYEVLIERYFRSILDISGKGGRDALRFTVHSYPVSSPLKFVVVIKVLSCHNGKWDIDSVR